MAAARTCWSSLVNDSPSSPHAWPVPMAGTTRPAIGDDALELAGVHQFWIPHGQFDTVVTPGRRSWRHSPRNRP